MKRILIIGATSTIAMACARKLIEDNSNFYLMGRNGAKLAQIKQDLMVRGATSVLVSHADLIDCRAHPLLIDQVWAELTEVDLVLIAHGSLPDQIICESEVAHTLKEFSINAVSVISLLSLIANKMAVQKSGVIAVISSVAGDRGRPSNYVYGAAKAAINTFCEGLRARMHKVGVHVLTIKPGFVDTPMTQGLSLPKLLVAKPQTVADSIIKAINRKKNTIYTPWFWSVIMKIINIIPHSIFKRMSL